MNENHQKLRGMLNSLFSDLKEANESILESFRPNNQFERGYLACLLGFINYFKNKGKDGSNNLFDYIIRTNDTDIVKINEFDDEWIIGYKSAIQDLIQYLKKISPEKSSADSKKDNP